MKSKTNILKNILWVIGEIQNYNNKYIVVSLLNAFRIGITPVCSLVVMQQIINLFWFFIAKFIELKSSFNLKDISLTKKITIFNSAFGLIESIIDGMIFIYIIYLGYIKVLLIGNSITYTRTVIQSKSAITNILTEMSNVYRESLFIDQIFELFILDEEDNNNKVKISSINSIETINLFYKYKNNSNYTLKNINIKIEKNKKIAIIGKNGSGKTILIKLLTNLL